MAVVRLADGQDKTLTTEKGLALYRVLKGLDEPANEQMEKWAIRTKKIYLNWRNAPDYYLIERKEALRDILMGYWMRNRVGNYTRPDPGDAVALHVSKVLGLWEHGKSTSIVDAINNEQRYNRQMVEQKRQQSRY